MLNISYRKKQMWLGRRSLTTLHNALFPVHTKQLYFKLFGTAGFHEVQAIIPIGSVAEYAEAIRDYLVRRPIAITLASGKIFRGRRELLRFTGDGICLALNFPASLRIHASPIPWLRRVIRRHSDFAKRFTRSTPSAGFAPNSRIDCICESIACGCFSGCGPSIERGAGCAR